MSKMVLDSDWGASTPKQQAPKQGPANFGDFRVASERSSTPAKQGPANFGNFRVASERSSTPAKKTGHGLLDPEADVMAALARRDAMRARAEGTQSPRESQGFAAGTRAGVSTPALMERALQERQQREEKVEAERAYLYGLRNSGRENPQMLAGGKETVLGVDEYNSLGGRHKAAVDFNGMLRAAYKSDDKLSGLDKDKSGHVTMSELNDDVDVRGYRAAYKRMFGVDPDANTTYSPATLGLLNSMDLRDTGGRIENFTKGRGYIDADEIGRGASDGAMQGPSLSPKWMEQQSRDDMVTKLTDGMSNLQKTLESGRVQVGVTGAKVRLGGVMPDEDRDNAVQVFRQGLRREDAQNSLKMLGGNPRFNPSDGLDLSSLVDPNEREQRLLMDDVARFALQSGVTAADLKDPAKLRAMQFGSGQTAGIDVDRFAEHIAEMEQGSVSKGITLEDDIMAQLGQLGG